MRNYFFRLAFPLRVSQPASSSQSGFTLIEMLVVIIFAGVLAAIAAPSWNVLVARQRSSAVRNDITQILRKAQADARRTRSARAVVFETGTTASLPRAAIIPFTATPIPTPANVSEPSWQVLGSADIPKGAVVLNGFGAASNTTLVFDSNGAVATSQTISGIPDQLTDSAPSFIIATATSQGNVRRCVIVQTLLGSLRTSDTSSECTRP